MAADTHKREIWNSQEPQVQFSPPAAPTVNHPPPKTFSEEGVAGGVRLFHPCYTQIRAVVCRLQAGFIRNVSPANRHRLRRWRFAGEMGNLVTACSRRTIAPTGQAGTVAPRTCV